MKKKLLIIVVVIIIGLVLSQLLFNMKTGSVYPEENIEFSKNGFVDSMSLSQRNYLVTENQKFELYIDEKTSYFKVVDKHSGMVWDSNPTLIDPWQFDANKNITTSALNRQKATLELSYFNEEGSLAKINNYRLSISHRESVLNEEGLRTFSIKYLDDGFQVLYELGDYDIDYLYFPKYLPAEILEVHPQRSMLQQLAYTGYDEELDAYFINDNDYKKMSVLVREKLYDVFYGPNSLGYTRERAIEENASYGYIDVETKISFEIAIEVKLTEKGMTMSVIKDSIVEDENAKLASVSLFPHFGTAISTSGDEETEGYIVLPDGSGAVMEFNNGKHYQQPYSKRLYGHDLGMLPYKMPETQQKISIPLYGMVKEDGGFAAIITEGDSSATINADVSGRVDSYNKVYPTFNFREYEAIILGNGFDQYALDLWTEDIIDTDFTVEYVFLEEDKADYVNIASAYRNHLEENHNFNSVDTSTETILTIEMLGAYEDKSFFLGIPYYRNKSLTNFEQSQSILEILKSRDINNLNVIYKGMVNGGLSSELSDGFNVEKVLGGHKDYQRLLDYTNDNNIDVYPSIKLLTANKFDKLFDNYRYASARINGDLSKNFTYHLPSKLAYSESPGTLPFEDDYVINPLYLEKIMEKLLKDYDENLLAFEFLGSSLGGSYGDQLIYKQDALRIQKQILSQLEENILLSNPLGFTFPYTDFATDLPLESTLYAILDYQIPLLQLVLTGKVDYSTVSLNLANQRSVQFYFLKTLESGSNLKYTVSHDKSTELKDTKFNYYYSTEYTNWIDMMEEQVKTLDEIGIHEGYLVDHERLMSNVFKVTYSHGLVILINYNLSPVENVLGHNIPAMDYLVLGEE
ncbi:MAG: DUF5696 domain-containing protein [Candidatus Izemoplasmatales bacterium]